MWCVFSRYNDEGKRTSQPRGGGQPFQPPADLRQVGQTGIVQKHGNFLEAYDKLVCFSLWNLYLSFKFELYIKVVKNS